VENALVTDGNNVHLFVGSDDHAQDTQVYAWFKKESKILYIVFRGTDSKSDWMTNLDVRKRCMGIEETILPVHNGFKNHFMSVEEQITHFIQLHEKDTKEIYFLGHSLGMACATISALYYNNYFCEKENKPIIHCHTFGGPRVGGDKFVEYYESQEHLMKHTWRVVDVNDPVPMTPFSSRFKHVGCHTMKLGSDKKFKYSLVDLNWMLRPIMFFSLINILNPISPHDIDRYIQKLKAIYELKHENYI
jgi:predicted lipase